MSDEIVPGMVLDGKIRIDSVLGSGGMGTVFRGTQIALERPVAVKMIRPEHVTMPELVERLRREALAVARLRHPNVVAVYDFHTTARGSPYIVMELVDGESLAEIIARDAPLPVATTVAIALQICAAVQAAHDVGIVHRDLKPQNIILESPRSNPHVKVLDFGIAKLIEQSTPDGFVTGEGAFVGTPAYMSPEQASGLPCDGRTDVYAIGCVLYAMATGQPPFTSPSVARMLVAHASTPPKPPSARVPSVPAWFDAVVLEALAKEPADRYETPAALARAIENGAGTTTQASPILRVPANEHDTPNNIPRLLTSFVSRDRIVRAARAAIDKARLVTFVGPAGVGKTRLAVHVAALRLGAMPDGVWFVDLASAAEPAGVARAIAATLDLRADSDAEAVDAVARRFESQRAMLVLDNCEHVAQACARTIGRLLESCPRLQVLATSRVALHVATETLFAVPSLEMPAGTTDDEIAASEAVQLFVSRARLVSAGFEPDGDDLAVIAEICRALDGLPLAIELAAARTRILTVHQINERLRDRLGLLKAADAAAERHQSLRAALDWSYEMLDETERLLFERLSVFAGGFTLDAVEGVCSGNGCDAADVLDTVAGLVDKSLVGVNHSGREARYFLLETVRVYAAEKLAASRDAVRVRAGHRDHFLALCEEAAPCFKRGGAVLWGARLQADLDNIRAALAFSRDEPGDGAALLRLAAAMHTFFYERGHLAEGLEWMQAAIERAGDTAPADTLAEALTGAGNLAHDLGDLATALAYQERVLGIQRARENEKGVAVALHNIANTLTVAGDFAVARDRFEESCRILRRVGSPGNLALSIYMQGVIAFEMGDLATASRLFGESETLYLSFDHAYGLSLVHASQVHEALSRGHLDRVPVACNRALASARRAENPHNIAAVALYRGELARHSGRFVEAESSCAEALEGFRALGDRHCASQALLSLARSARQQSDLDRAAARLAESLAIRADIGAKKDLAECFEESAALASARGDLERAARLLGAASAVRERIGAPVYPVDADARAAVRDAVRASLGDAAFTTAFGEGTGLDLDAACALARRALAQT